MRLSLVLVAASLAACSPADPAAGGASPAGIANADGAKPAAGTPTVIKAADGVTVYGTLYAAADPKAIVLLFHQAGSGKGEYATIAPRLVAMGYSALAIDQRSGGDLFGQNQTADAVSGQPSYLDAKADLQAALNWAKPQGKPVLLWGSSYSSALVFLVAAENPGAVAGLLSFSPGEYLGQPDLVMRNAAKLAIPVFVTSAKDAGEIAAAKAIVNAVPGKSNVQAVPAIAGVHGSSTLIAARNPRGADDNWRAVTEFLSRVAP
ncbi:MAG: hypothetical protein B7Y43_09760 [Sphingomonas sp. 28-62-20]|uniref:alpha/beta hydrolase n=1 Tax=unclassified Sphingomonas TaxID=196159 RepID=UPI000A61E647|nr:lysophospholipase [Sphingomonas sp.]OYY77610.1 MAG: hypothetical protein B7Y43_09760 [Sphingomonas sp. 28-62-20]